MMQMVVIEMLPAGSKVISRVVSGELCSGCGLCASLSGTVMRATALGYNRPGDAPPVTEERERILADSCPGSRLAPWQAAPQVHAYWGPFHQLLTGHSSDEAVRFKASSGGAITALALHALETGFVEGVVQVRADPQRPTRNVVAISRTRREVLDAAGSRYAASSPLEGIDAILRDGGRFVFIGKPCDCSALRQLGLHDARVAEKLPLILSFFCAGIPSEKGALDILDHLGIAPAEVAEFRYRGHGWPGRATAIAHDGRSVDMSYEESWGGYLSKQVQFRCKICPDALGGVADIACADAWYGGESGYPTFEELAGRSLVMSRTERGDAFLREAMAAGALVAEPLAPDQVEEMQPSQAQRKRLIAARLLAVRAAFQPAPRVSGVKVLAAARKAGLIESARNFAGTLRRIILDQR